MSHTVWFRAPLECLHCGSHIGARETRLSTSSFGVDPLDESVHPGEVLELTLDDFDAGYLTLHHPGDAPNVRALEQWGCPVCGHAQWAQIDFQRVDPTHYRFVGAHTVPLTPGSLDRVHYVSLRLAPWLETNPGEETDRLLAVLGPSSGSR